MTEHSDRRRSRTRRALIDAAQRLIAEGRLNPPIATVTAAAGIGLGSFYNHFSSRDELFQHAGDEALDQLGQILDELAPDGGDPAEDFARSFRLMGRLHRRHPEMSKVILRTAPPRLPRAYGISTRLRRDIRLGMDSGRFLVSDLDVAVSTIIGAGLALGHLVHYRDDIDPAAAADESCSYLLRLLGLPPAEADRISRAPLPRLPDRTSWHDVQ